jgi:hypothetical protein
VPGTCRQRPAARAGSYHRDTLWSLLGPPRLWPIACSMGTRDGWARDAANAGHVHGAREIEDTYIASVHVAAVAGNEHADRMLSCRLETETLQIRRFVPSRSARSNQRAQAHVTSFESVCARCSLLARPDPR